MHFQRCSFILRTMKRVYERLLKESLEQFPCVALVGARQCGKTTLLETLPPQWKKIDLERQADLDLVAKDPDLFFRLNPENVAIDEVQYAPEVFGALRVAIDARRQVRGRFVITGSSSPELLRSVSESLAGRVAIIEMAPFAWEEVYPRRDPALAERLCERSLSARDLIDGLNPRADERAVHEYWFRGGYPELWMEKSERFRARWMEQYTRTYLERDVARLFPGLDHPKFRLFLQHLAGYSGTIINYAEVARALGVSQPTARDYFQIAHGTFVWRQVPAYVKGASRRLVRHPKGYLRDSGLCHHLQRIPDQDGLLTHPRMGASWEGLVIEELLRQWNGRGVGFDCFYYRTAGGAEVDLVVEGEMGLIGIEIKHGQSVDWRTVGALERFIAEHRARMGLVIGNGDAPRLLSDRVAAIPFSHL